LPIGVSGVSVKEVVEMIESRIPGGRYVISILLSLLVLTGATASAVYLYHALVLPMVSGVSSLVTTGRVPSTMWGALIGSTIGGIFLALTHRFLLKSILNSYQKVSNQYERFAEGLSTILDKQDALGQRLGELESRVSALEK